MTTPSRGGGLSRVERLGALLEQLVAQGRLEVEDAARRFEVSAATIRRDLDHLSRQQLLDRTHGGAVPSATSYDLPLRFKASSDSTVKARLARRAADLLWPGCVVSLNGGTTTVEVARAIPATTALHAGVTVVTNALNIATELTVRPYIKIVVCGGVARQHSYELVGAMAIDALRQLTPDVCFLGASGVDLHAGVTAADEAEAAVSQVMVQQARRTFVVASSDKLGQVRFARICRLSEVTGLLTDTDADPAQLAEVRALGLEVLQA